MPPLVAPSATWLLVNGQVKGHLLSKNQILFLRVVAKGFWLLLITRILKNQKPLALLFFKWFYYYVYVCLCVGVCV